MSTDERSAHGLAELVPWELLDIFPAGVLLVSRAGRILAANRSIESMSGYSRRELVGQQVELLVPEQARARHTRLRDWYAVSQTERFAGRKLELRRREGTCLPVAIRLHPTVVAGREAIAVAVRPAVRRRSGDHLRRLLADLVPDPVVISDVETGLVEYANQAACDLLGYLPGELTGLPLERLNPAVDPEQRRRWQAELFGPGQERQLPEQVVLQGRGGHAVRCRLELYPLPGEDGPARIVNVLHPPGAADGPQPSTPSRRTESETFRLAFEHAPSGMALTRLEPGGARTIVRANSALATTLGVADTAALIGRDWSEFSFPQDEPDAHLVMSRILAGDLNPISRTRRYRRTDGSTAWLEVRVTPVDLPAPIGKVLFSHLVDVTARQRDELRRAGEAAVTQALAEITRELLAGADADRMYSELTAAATRITLAGSAGLLLPDPDTGRPIQLGAVGPQNLPLGDDADRWRLRTVEIAHQAGRALAFEKPPAEVPDAVRQQVGPYAVAPLVVQGRRGLLGVARAPGGALFDELELQLLEELAGEVAPVLELAELRREQDLALRVSEESFRIAFEQAPTGMAVTRCTPEGRWTILQANDALAQLVGVAQAEHLVGRDWSEFAAPEDEADARAATADLISGRITRSHQVQRLHRADGGVRWAEVRAGAVRLPGRPEPLVLTHVSDVTEQREAQRRREGQATVSRLLAEITATLLAGGRPDQVLADLALAAAELTGGTDATVVVPAPDSGAPVRIAVSGSTVEELPRAGTTFSSTVIERMGQSPRRAMNLPELPAETDPLVRGVIGPSMVAPVALGSGQEGLIAVARAPGALPFTETDLELFEQLADRVGLVLDVATVRADQERRIRLSEQTLRVAFDQAPTGMSLTRLDEAGNRFIVRANAALAAMVGEPDPAVLVGREFAGLLDHEDEVASRKLAARLVRGESRELSVLRRMRRPDGSRVWVQVHGALVEDPGEVGPLLLAHYVDVTAAHEAELRRAGEAMADRRLTEISGRLLAGDEPEQLYADLVAAAAELTGCGDATLALAPDGADYVRVSTCGPIAAALRAEGVPVHPGLVGAAFAAGRTIAFPVIPPGGDPRVAARYGPALVAPMSIGGEQRAVLGVGREPGAEPFSALHRELLDRITSQAGIMLGVARARAEQERRIRASEESFRASFEQAPSGMALLRVGADGNRIILRGNQPLALLLGLDDAEQLAGRDFADFTVAEEEAEARASLTRLAAGRDATIGRRKRYRRPDGSVVWAESRATVIDLPGATETLALAHCVDVTDQVLRDRGRAGEAILDRRLAEMTARLLAGDEPEQVYADLAAAAAELCESLDATLVVPERPDGELVRVAAVGPAAGRLFGAEPQVVASIVGPALAAGHAVAFTALPPDTPEELRRGFGPWAAVPVTLGAANDGVITVGRPPGASPFGEIELDLLNRLASQARLTLELARARSDQERLRLLEDRQRIARELHDTVIQDLIAVGMQLNSQALRPPECAQAQQRADLVAQIESAVGRLRSAVFSLRHQPPTSALVEVIEQIVRDASRILGHRPAVSVQAEVAGLTGTVAAELTAVLREALSNVARHAQAGASAVSLIVRDGQVVLTVEDDGRGLPTELVPGDGLRNLRERARVLHGTSTVGPRPGGGTRLEWLCPLPG